MQRISRIGIRSLLPYGRQWIDKEDVKAVGSALRGDFLTTGPLVATFENAVAAYCKTRYAVAVSSGTAALHAAYAAAGIEEGDEVIVPALTFSATANAVVYCGGTPVLCDILKDTLCIDPRDVEERITKKTKAIAPVDFAGHPAEYRELRRIARRHGLLLIADAAHSLGSEYRGMRTGSLADMTILSFHPVKTITTGEGGMVLTNSRAFAENARRFRHHGIEKTPKFGGWSYDIKELGYNYRLTDVQCALGISQLGKISRFISRRREIVKRYNAAFAPMREVVVPKERSYARAVYHIYPIQFAEDRLNVDRRTLYEEFHKRGIGVQVHYIPVHTLSWYRRAFGYRKGDFPEAEQYYERALSLPLFPGMTDKEVDLVITTTQKLVSRYRV